MALVPPPTHTHTTTTTATTTTTTPVDVSQRPMRGARPPRATRATYDQSRSDAQCHRRGARPYHLQSKTKCSLGCEASALRAPRSRRRDARVLSLARERYLVARGSCLAPRADPRAEPETLIARHDAPIIHPPRASAAQSREESAWRRAPTPARKSQSVAEVAQLQVAQLRRREVLPCGCRIATDARSATPARDAGDIGPVAQRCAMLSS